MISNLILIHWKVVVSAFRFDINIITEKILLFPNHKDFLYLFAPHRAGIYLAKSNNTEYTQPETEDSDVALLRVEPAVKRNVRYAKRTLSFALYANKKVFHDYKKTLVEKFYKDMCREAELTRWSEFLAYSNGKILYGIVKFTLRCTQMQ